MPHKHSSQKKHMAAVTVEGPGGAAAAGLKEAPCDRCRYVASRLCVPSWLCACYSCMSPLSPGRTVSAVSTGCSQESWAKGDGHWGRTETLVRFRCPVVFCIPWQLARCGTSLGLTVRESPEGGSLTRYAITPSGAFSGPFPGGTPGKCLATQWAGQDAPPPTKCGSQSGGGVPFSIVFPSMGLVATSRFCPPCVFSVLLISDPRIPHYFNLL